MEQSCGAVVFIKNNETEYLLLHYGKGHWGFVKGHIENMETEKETTLRELKEETGLSKVEFVEGFKEKKHYSYKRNKKIIYKKVTYFLIQAQHKKIKLSNEHIGYEWLNYERAKEKLSFKNSKNILKKAHKLLETIYPHNKQSTNKM